MLDCVCKRQNFRLQQQTKREEHMNDPVEDFEYITLSAVDPAFKRNNTQNLVSWLPRQYFS